MIQILKQFAQTPKNIQRLALGDLFLHIMQASFFLTLNYALVDQGYSDAEIPNFNSYRFIAVMLIAFPLGLLIKGKKLRPFFVASAILNPIFGLATVAAIQMQAPTLIKSGLFFYGASFALMRVCALPYIMNNAPESQRSESIIMLFQTFSLGIFFCGILSAILQYINPIFFTNINLMYLFSALSVIGLIFILRITDDEKIAQKKGKNLFDQDYDWSKIAFVMGPTIIIAIGAGFTIPYINLFFLRVHNVPLNQFALMGALTYLAVAFLMLFMPSIKRKFGFGIAITLFQSLAVISLILMCTTELYKEAAYAFGIALFFYLIRQPFMNVAGPMTSELSMTYVGPKNQQLISALMASIWSGSWFISSKLFEWFKAYGLPFWQIFLLCALLYGLGIIWYAFIIRAYYRKVSKERMLQTNH